MLASSLQKLSVRVIINLYRNREITFKHFTHVHKVRKFYESHTRETGQPNKLRYRVT